MAQKKASTSQSPQSWLRQPLFALNSGWLRRTFFQSVIVFLVVAGGVSVYAAVITWPDEPYTPTGLEAIFVGASTGKYVASLDYVAANDACKKDAQATLKGSHICTADEILHSYNEGVVAALNQAGASWFNNGPPGYNATLVNDCAGWTATNSTTYGSVWDFTNKKSQIMPCDVNTLTFACCK